MSAAPAPVARQRRQTLYFLDEIRGFSPVFLDTEVDMTRIKALRSDPANRYSVPAYILYAAARAIARHPEANAAISGGRRPKVARYGQVNAKLALDKQIAGQRVVLAAVLPDVDRSSLAEIQRQLEHYRDGDPATMPEFAGVRALHKLPERLGRGLFRSGVRPLRARAGRMGTFALTSLGHRPVDGFHSVGGTTITLGVGRILDRPVARDGRVEIAALMRLSLAFDHRVVDGAEAADLLADIKSDLEEFPG